MTPARPVRTAKTKAAPCGAAEKQKEVSKMQIINPTTNRLAELETLRAELAEAHWRLTRTSNEGKQVILHQIRQIKRDIQRNSVR